MNFDNVFNTIWLSIVPLVSAIIGGWMVFMAQKKQWREEQRGAVRAVTAELLKNAALVSATREGVQDAASWDFVWGKDHFTHNALDTQLPLLALVLSPDDLVVLLGAYAGLGVADVRLARAHQLGAGGKPPEAEISGLASALKSVSVTLDAALGVLATANLWTAKEREYLSGARGELRK